MLRCCCRTGVPQICPKERALLLGVGVCANNVDELRETFRAWSKVQNLLSAVAEAQVAKNPLPAEEGGSDRVTALLDAFGAIVDEKGATLAAAAVLA